jgi:hypothetical protein
MIWLRLRRAVFFCGYSRFWFFLSGLASLRENFSSLSAGRFPAFHLSPITFHGLLPLCSLCLCGEIYWARTVDVRPGVGRWILVNEYFFPSLHRSDTA